MMDWLKKIFRGKMANYLIALKEKEIHLTGELQNSGIVWKITEVTSKTVKLVRDETDSGKIKFGFDEEVLINIGAIREISFSRKNETVYIHL